MKRAMPQATRPDAGAVKAPPPAADGAASFADLVRAGLMAPQKTLPTKFLYDELGSQLFEAICFLPEYYLTRTERRILTDNAADIAAHMGPDARLVELGAGSASKTRIIIAAMLQRSPDLLYCPIDISEEAMRIAQANITSTFPGVRFKGVIGDWFAALERMKATDRHQKLVAFLGSSIGNMDHGEAVAFLARLRERTGGHDKLLLGTDMVKPASVLIPAYDDAAGVTAAFNKNLLVRMNHEFGARFDTSTFRHEARWDEAHRRIEMHLVSTKDQSVAVTGLDLVLRFRAGESIHTENSHKYRMEDIQAMARESGYSIEATWMDADRLFAVHLLTPA